MLCESCKKRQATVRYRENINGKVTEKFLCAECAKANGYYDKMNVFEGSFINPAEFITSVFEPKRSQEVTCKGCGTTSEEFRETGYLGCPDCYATFADLVMPMVRRVQGGVQHVGKGPNAPTSKMSEREKLELQLKHAVDSEEYEEAARIRDAIKALKEDGKNG